MPKKDTQSNKDNNESSVKSVIAAPVASLPEYRLSGPQVEPGSAYWNRCPFPRPITLNELLAVTEDTTSNHFFPSYPTDADVVAEEFKELMDLQKLRNDPTQVTSTEPGKERLPISTFLQLRPPPLRAGVSVNMSRQDSFPVIFNGSELARYFENNTPGAGHRQALNYLIHYTNWSPARQALVWTALDLTIYSALTAAWYYKWISPRANTSRRQRPIEYAIDNGFADEDENDKDDDFTVLYDRAVNSTGSSSDGHRPNFPVIPGGAFIASSPGTPRHPAYPSGHSTYAGAASELLSFFFPDYRRELDFLADNTGIARLWAGIHWRTDHERGMKLGRTVACLMIDQLRRIGIPLVPPQRDLMGTPPSREELQEKSDAFAANCSDCEPPCNPGAQPADVPGLLCPTSEPCVPPKTCDETKKEGDTNTSDTKGESFVG